MLAVKAPMKKSFMVVARFDSCQHSNTFSLPIMRTRYDSRKHSESLCIARSFYPTISCSSNQIPKIACPLRVTQGTSQNRCHCCRCHVVRRLLLLSVWLCFCCFALALLVLCRSRLLSASDSKQLLLQDICTLNGGAAGPLLACCNLQEDATSAITIVTSTNESKNFFFVCPLRRANTHTNLV